MATFNPVGPAAPSTVANRSKTTPSIQNVSLPSADTEVSISIPAGVVKFMLRARGKSRLQLAYTATESGTTYLSLPPRNIYYEDNLTASASPLTIYVQSNISGDTVEVLTWI